MAVQAREHFKENLPIPEGLDLVEDQDVQTHDLDFNETYKTRVELDVFKHNQDWQAQDKEYQVSTTAACQLFAHVPVSKMLISSLAFMLLGPGHAEPDLFYHSAVF